jgi:hypothetical protein
VPKGLLIVESRPADPARVDEYNDWYANTHMPEVCAVPGFVAARRYRVRDESGGDRYIAVYDIDSDDLTAPLRDLRARSGDGRARAAAFVSMDPPPVVTLCELVDEVAVN